MKPKKYAPRPITSFLEDEIDPDVLRREMQKSLRIEAAEKSKMRSRSISIAAIRIILPLVAVALSLWLYTLVDNFINHHQYQRLQRRLAIVNLIENDFRITSQ